MNGIATSAHVRRTVNAPVHVHWVLTLIWSCSTEHTAIAMAYASAK